MRIQVRPRKVLVTVTDPKDLLPVLYVIAQYELTATVSRKEGQGMVAVLPNLFPGIADEIRANVRESPGQE